MRYDQLFTKLFCTPLCLEVGTRHAYERVLLAYIHGTPAPLPFAEVPEITARRPLDPQTSRANADSILEFAATGTAIIHIDGTIDRHVSAFQRSCGLRACDVEDIRGAVERCANDQTIKNILLSIDSPGGTVAGLPETHADIAALAKVKNVHTWVDGQCCSAAYWLASASAQIFASPSSMVGSIGVYLALLNESKALENRGLKVETIQDGTLKTAGASFKPLSDEERAHLQSLVNEIGTLFRTAVTAQRPGVTSETMQGQSYFGASAIQAQLVDAILPHRAAALAQFP